MTSSKYCCRLQINEQRQTVMLQGIVKITDKRRKKLLEKNGFLEKNDLILFLCLIFINWCLKCTKMPQVSFVCLCFFTLLTVLSLQNVIRPHLKKVHKYMSARYISLHYAPLLIRWNLKKQNTEINISLIIIQYETTSMYVIKLITSS